MSSTRYAHPDSPRSQNRWASDPAFERGLNAALVAKRCSVLSKPADRDLVWFLHAQSWREGGLADIASWLLENCRDRLGTATMRNLGVQPGQVYTREQVEAMRYDNPRERQSMQLRKQAELCRALSGEDHAGETHDTPPVSCSPETFLDQCMSAAKQHLPADLEEFCLNPSRKPSDAWPWYFVDLVPALRDYLAHCVTQARPAALITIGEFVWEALDRCARQRGLTLIQGQSGTSKSFSAEAWCLTHPGRGRFSEVAPGNADETFLRSLARDLGLGNFSNYKTLDIRDRVEKVLLTGDLVLVLDEAHRLWPQGNSREASPKRIEWIMSMVNKGVPICLLSTDDQFFRSLERTRKVSGWNVNQLTRRIEQFVDLPNKMAKRAEQKDCEVFDLWQRDLCAVAQAMLPELDAKTAKAIATYACKAGWFVATVKNIVGEAQELAKDAGRQSVAADDIRSAMKGGGIVESQSDLARAMAAAAKPTSGRRSAAPRPSMVTAAIEEPETPSADLGQRASRPSAAEPSAWHGRSRGVQPVLVNEA